MTPTTTIAIDGFSSCGKSTLARDMANALDYIYVDSGAMYRAVTLYLLNNGISFNNLKEVKKALPHIKIEFKQVNNKTHIFLNGIDVEKDIRLHKVSNHVSEVATISDIRSELVNQQRKLAQHKNVVMDGRDIGTVVFPNAEIKIFVTADLKERTHRRWKELKDRGKKISKKEVEKNLSKRDQIDSTRKDSPLRKADDAYDLDTTHLTRKEQLKKALSFVENSKNKPPK